MRKMTLLAAALLSVACIGGQTLTASAAPASKYVSNLNGGRIVVTYGSSCDLSSLLEQFKNCFPPSQQPSVPETNLPNVPEEEVPDKAPDSDNNTSEDTEALSYQEKVVQLVNAERAKEGLSALTIAKDVTKAAQVRAEEIVTSFSHTRPDGTKFTTALKEQNISYRSAGENIAWGQRSPEEVVTAWMNSAGHRANIMNAKFTAIGVGYYENTNGTKYWSQLFTY